MQKYKKELVLILFALILAGPAIYHGLPQYYFMPDLQFVKAKVLRVAAGDLFADPVTGFPTFHPPFYHLFISGLAGIGIDIDVLLLIISILNVALTILLIFMVLRFVLDETTAFLTALIFPFIIRFMGPGYMLLATAFYFSVPFYLIGLWLFLKQTNGMGRAALLGLLWGIAFLISPGYLFLIGFAFLYLLYRKRWKSLAFMAAVFLVCITPFLYQGMTIYGSGMAGTSAFAFWRGFPGVDWWTDFFRGFLSPALGKSGSWQSLVALGVVILGIIGLWRTQPKSCFPIIAALALLFTAYHFNYQYASRVQFFLSIFLAGYAIQFLLRLRFGKSISMVVIVVLFGYGLYDHLPRAADMTSSQKQQYIEFRNLATGLHDYLNGQIDPDRFVLCTDYTYRNFILPYFAAHALVAYKTGEYFQLKSELADEMLGDYERLMRADEIGMVEFYCRKYRIQTAVAGIQSEAMIPVFRTISIHWPTVYRDDYFRVFQKPEVIEAP